MNVYYLLDEAAREKANRAGNSYWFCYAEELFDNLGVTAHALSESDLSDTKLDASDFLFIGPDEPGAGCKAAVAKAAGRGCTVVAFGTPGLDDVFGIRTGELLPQPEGPFSLAGYFDVRADKLCEYLPVPQKELSLPVFAPVRLTSADRCEVIADIRYKERLIPGFTKAKDTEAYYFSFDLTQSIWASRQGKPGTEGGLVWWRRIADMRITPDDYDTKIAYNDYYLYLLQYILAKKGMPMLHRLPPLADGRVPDFVLFYQGDEDSLPQAERASEIMYKRGLPYHINVMPDPETGKYIMTKEEYERIKARGHTIGVHQNFLTDLVKFSQEGFWYHTSLFEQTYGEKPYSGLTHACYVSGWAELARYQAATGLKAQNIWSAELTPPDDINAFNLCGMAFGTAYPFFFYDDAEHENQRIPLIALPNSYYEPRIGEGFESGREMIRAYLDDSAFFGRTSAVFIHPHYLLPPYNFELTFAALDEFDRYCEEKGYVPCRYTPDQLTRWWHERSASSLSDIRREKGRTAFTVAVEGDTGMIIKIPAGAKDVRVTVDGRPAQNVRKRVEGREWVLIPVTESGEHAVEIMEA